MKDISGNKLELLSEIRKLIKTIDDEIDWFIASFQEKDPKRRTLARFMSDKKEDELEILAKEICERYK